MSNILHEQIGLKIRKNPKNKVCVIELDFIADPLKRHPNWIVEASAGMSEAQVRREFFRDYTALSGAKVFPQAIQYEDRIFVKPPYPDIQGFKKFWAGFDYGTRNPTAFIIFAEGKNADGETCIYAVWEHYEPTKNLQRMCDIIKSCEYFPFIKWISCDRKIWDKNQQREGIKGLTSIADLMIENGITKIIPGGVNEESFISYVHSLWGGLEEEEGTSKFLILDRCVNLKRELQNIVYVALTAQGNKNKSLNEGMINKDNHALDATKYFMSTYSGLPKVKNVANPSRRVSLNEIWRRNYR